MAKKLSANRRNEIITMLEQGQDRQSIASVMGVSPAQVSAVSAHITMGTYGASTTAGSDLSNEVSETTMNMLSSLQTAHLDSLEPTDTNPIPLGINADTNQTEYWNPYPNGGSHNPHILILGESGTGKTYTTSCILAVLAQANVPSIVFDYGQGFSAESLDPIFSEHASPIEIQASRDGIAINPLQIFPFDMHGPINVAQRIADTFSRVYSRIGIQQHAVLRQAILEVFTDAGIVAETPDTWTLDLPSFSAVQKKLIDYSIDPDNPGRNQASSVASHISTLFVFNTFRPEGEMINWFDILQSGGHCFIVQLKGLEHSLERAVTEFLLWNFIGFVDSLGPGPLRAFIVLDEAHKLSFDQDSPVEKLLREGRKFGLGLILASQQPDDFSPIAFSNTATKIVFQVGDDRGLVARQLSRKVRGSHSFSDIAEIISKLPRSWAYVVSENEGRVVRILSFSERERQWKQ